MVLLTCKQKISNMHWNGTYIKITEPWEELPKNKLIGNTQVTCLSTIVIKGWSQEKLFAYKSLESGIGRGKLEEGYRIYM